MKNKQLLIAITCAAFHTSAQQHPIPIAPMDREVSVKDLHRFLAHESAGGAHKTTSGIDRWFNYAQYLDTSLALARTTGGLEYLATYALPLWNDTNGTIVSSPGLVHNNMVSIGSILQPQVQGFKRCDLYLPEPIYISNSDPFTVDSIQILSYYGRDTSKKSIVDTLRLTFLHGDGGLRGSSDIWSGWGYISSHYGSVGFLEMFYDSVMNRGTGSFAPQYQDVLLHNSDSGVYAKVIPLVHSDGITPWPINALPGELIGVTITFKSGDPATTGILSTSTPGDTLIRDVAPFYKYNVFRPYVDYYTKTAPGPGTLPLPDYFLLVAVDHNAGYFKKLPDYLAHWDSIYIPLWAVQDTGASYLQYPDINWHIKCLTCMSVYSACNSEVTKIENAVSIDVFPNPASEQVIISYSFPNSVGISIKLFNMVGQMVAGKYLDNSTTGEALFNTALFPAGMYIYTVEANGEKYTGKVTIAH